MSNTHDLTQKIVIPDLLSLNTTAERTYTLPPASWRRPHVTPYIHYLSRYHLNNEAITLRLTEFYLFIRWSSSKKIFGGNLAVSNNFGPAVKMDTNPGKAVLVVERLFWCYFFNLLGVLWTF